MKGRRQFVYFDISPVVTKWQETAMECERLGAFYLLKTNSKPRGLQYLKWAKEIRLAHCK